MSEAEIEEEFGDGEEAEATTGLTFGEAIDRMKRGLKVSRAGWNGKGMWIRMIDLYSDREFSVQESADSVGTWMPFIVMKTPTNTLHPWNASQADALANDWAVAV